MRSFVHNTPESSRTLRFPLKKRKKFFPGGRNKKKETAVL
jgi:hypothetical protein